MTELASSLPAETAAFLLSLASLACSLLCSAHLLAHALTSLRARGASAIAVLGAIGALALLACGGAPAAAHALGWEGVAKMLAHVAGACAVWLGLTVLALNVHAARHRSNPSAPIDFIIVPGAALRDAEPSPILAARLDRALELWRADGCRGRIIVSGGQGPDECVSEASAMRAYLQAHDVPSGCILEEPRSTTTYENMRFSLALLERQNVAARNAAVAVVSTDYHLVRCMHYARRCGAPVVGVGASSAGRQWSRGYLREVAAFTKMLLPSYIVPITLGLAIRFVC